jgi:enoyl-CoA hydratase/carnithine racemase
MSASIRIEERADVRHVIVANHPKLNTVNSALLDQLAAAFDVAEDTRAVVLTGEGERAFIGGADIREMGAIATPDAARNFITRVHRACAAIRACRVPVIARVQGWCLGAGMEIAAACDMRVASTAAKFGMPEVRVGIPSVVEAALLPALIGWGRTRRLLLLAETIDAATAEAWGFCERLVEPDALDGAVEEWIALLREAGPRAIAIQKALIRSWEDLPMKDAIAAGIPAFASSWESEEPRKMMARFLHRPR